MCFSIEKEKTITPEKIEAATPFEEGIYFDMPEEEYFRIPYFSRSGAEKILFSQEQYWYDSPMNPNYKPMAATPAMELGKAIHCQLLEPKRFKELYAKEPSLSDFNNMNVLRNSEDIKAFLTSVGEKKTGKKDELISRAAEYLDPRTDVIWDTVINNFNADVAATGKRIINERDVEVIDGIKESFDIREQMPSILKETRSEIVVIWKDETTGVMCKCMIDAARPEAIGEVKSFSVKNFNIPIEQTMLKELNARHYNHQYFVYSMALKTVIKKINAGEAKVFGEVNPQWLKEFLAIPNKRFLLMFFRTQAPYQCKTYELEEAFVHDATTNVYFDQATILWRAALTKLQSCYSRFGVNRWLDDDEVVTLTDEHMPSILYQTTGI
jgi:hypothetical protein